MELFKIISTILTIAAAILAVWITNVYLKDSNVELDDFKPMDDEIAMKNGLSLDNPEIDDMEDGPQWGVYLIHPILNQTIFFPVDKQFMEEYGSKFNYSLDPLSVPVSGEKSGDGSVAGGGGGASPGGRGNSPREKPRPKGRHFCPRSYFLRKHVCSFCQDENDVLAFTNRRVEEAYAQVR